MKTLSRFAAAAALAVSTTVLAAAQALAEDSECRGTLGPVAIAGNVIVPDDATCTLNGTYVQGSITVKSRATLDANAVQVTGGLQGESPTNVVVTRSRFGNSISIRKAGDFGGKIDISGTQVSGDVQLEENRNPITLRDNDIMGSVQANKNTGGLEITGNRIGNGLQCQDNRPAPVGGGNIAKQKQGQCQFL